MTASVLKHQTHSLKGPKEQYLSGQDENQQIFGVIPFVRLQNDA